MLFTVPVHLFRVYLSQLCSDEVDVSVSLTSWLLSLSLSMTTVSPTNLYDVLAENELAVSTSVTSISVSDLQHMINVEFSTNIMSIYWIVIGMQRIYHNSTCKAVMNVVQLAQIYNTEEFLSSERLDHWAYKKNKQTSVWFFTYFSHMLGLTVEKSGTLLSFPNGVEVNGPGNKHDKRNKCEKVWM